MDLLTETSADDKKEMTLTLLFVFLVGVWHNFVLCVAALAFLFLLPLFLFPVYSTGSGALVTEIVQVGAACF